MLKGKLGAAKIGAFVILIILPVVLFVIFKPTVREDIIKDPEIYFMKIDSTKRGSQYILDTTVHTIPDFNFVNHLGDSVSRSDVEGKVFVTDFFFSTCPGICPIMTKQMERVQKTFAANEELVILSITVDPEGDSLDALFDYAEKHNVVPNKWHLLTGDKPTIYELARKGYFVTASEGDGGPDDFVHTEKFVLVDEKLRIRGYYDGTDSLEVNRLMNDIVALIDY